ncbi:cytochrome P450 [Propioniciclava soli]|uniref:Cytochrome P450 n=1 Tax=Propioniciclava soli TaxID=2775081 RepID=A0ABZ3C7X3_9ACTN
MTTTPRIPGPAPLSVLRGLSRRGFLDEMGHQWRTHGDTFAVRLGPQSMVLVVHPDAVRDVHLTRRRSFDKRKSYDGVRRYLTGDGLIASTGELWKRQRKLMAPFFTPRAVQTYADLMLADADRVVSHWRGLAASGVTVDMGEEMMELTASIILRAVFSTAAEEDIVRLKSRVETMIRYTTRRAVLPVPDWAPTPANRRYREARDEVHAYIDDLIAQRRAREAAGEPVPDDLLGHLMAARDSDGGAMRESLLRDEAITMFFAGHETTARTLAAAWAALAAHPDVADRLHAELDAELGEGPVTLEALKRLPYTLQVTKEVLRLYPAAPFYMRDAVEPVEIGGWDLTPGTAVMLTPYWTHRHPDFWGDPERFDPDRFTPEAEATRHPQAYFPFATGERVCIGNHFSLLESHLLLAVLARRFAPVVVGDPPRWLMAGVLSPEGGLPTVIRER